MREELQLVLNDKVKITQHSSAKREQMRFLFDVDIALYCKD